MNSSLEVLCKWYKMAEDGEIYHGQWCTIVMSGGNGYTPLSNKGSWNVHCCMKNIYIKGQDKKQNRF